MRTLAPGTDPADFLACFEGEPRGFWGRGDQWVAWGGVVGEVRLDAGGGPSEGGRFEEVRARAGQLLASRTEAGGGDAGLRMFGGFSFLEDPAGNGSWGGFPVARFLLPRVILEGRGGTCRIRALDGGASAPVPGGSEPSEPEARRGPEAEIARIVARLEEAVAADRARGPAEPPAPLGEVAEEVGEEAWTNAVEKALAHQRRASAEGGEAGGPGPLEKVVLARTRDVILPGDVSVPRLLRFLRHENRRAHVFVFEPEPGRVLFGAAPEVLAELRGGRFHATAVAGSAPRGRTSHEEQLFAGGLLASAKDRAEHRMTLEEMVEALRPRLTTLDVPESPGVLTLARIQHLETPIHGEAGPGEDILGLVEALHPTPAVCGRPRATALAFLREAEPFERGWYAGPVGWLDGNGDGDFVPALRIGVGGGRRWRLYAGAGIVEGSDPHSEWEETALKFEPAHRALRAGLDPESAP